MRDGDSVAIEHPREEGAREDARALPRSALYVGTVRHRRHGRPADEFRFPLFMAYVRSEEHTSELQSP